MPCSLYSPLTRRTPAMSAGLSPCVNDAARLYRPYGPRPTMNYFCYSAVNVTGQRLILLTPHSCAPWQTIAPTANLFHIRRIVPWNDPSKNTFALVAVLVGRAEPLRPARFIPGRPCRAPLYPFATSTARRAPARPIAPAPLAGLRARIARAAIRPGRNAYTTTPTPQLTTGLTRSPRPRLQSPPLPARKRPPVITSPGAAPRPTVHATGAAPRGNRIALAPARLSRPGEHARPPRKRLSNPLCPHQKRP